MEIDGEFCIPHEINEARHVVDWGPFEPPRGPWYVVRKVLLFLPAMFLFILAIQIMKAGAAAIGPGIQGQFPFANGISTLGFGWLGALLRAVGVAGRGHGDQPVRGGHAHLLQTFTMLSGSRLGASFIVLLTGFLYALRNRTDPNRKEPIGMGIQALTMTALVYLPGMILGYWIIRSGLLDGMNLHVRRVGGHAVRICGDRPFARSTRSCRTRCCSWSGSWRSSRRSSSWTSCSRR